MNSRVRASSACLVAMLTAGPASAQTTREEALAAVYPGATVRTEQVFLTPSQQKQVLMRGDTDVPTAFVARYVATRDGKVVGRAYVDTPTVHTKKDSLLISLDAAGQLLRIDVIGATLAAPEVTNAVVRRIRAIDAVLEKREAR